MSEIMLNTTLNKLDGIIFHDCENGIDVNKIIKILNDVHTSDCICVNIQL